MAEETYQEGIQGPKSVGMAGDHPEKGNVATAHDIKDLNHQLGNLDDSDLKSIPVMSQGSRLEQGATYIDLRGDCTEFTAMGNESAGSGNAYVAKTEVAYPLWNRLIGVENPERLDQAGQGATED